MITRAKMSAVRASGVRRLFEGGAYSSKYGTVIIIINLIWNVSFFVVSLFDLLSNLTTPGPAEGTFRRMIAVLKSTDFCKINMLCYILISSLLLLFWHSCVLFFSLFHDCDIRYINQLETGQNQYVQQINDLKEVSQFEVTCQLTNGLSLFRPNRYALASKTTFPM